MRFNLEKTAYDLRDKQVLSVDEAKIESVDVVRPKGGFSLARGEGAQAWKMTKPRAQEADGQTVINLLGQLKSERATAFVADSRRRDGEAFTSEMIFHKLGDCPIVFDDQQPLSSVLVH